jgi:hypothetical protein
VVIKEQASTEDGASWRSIVDLKIPSTEELLERARWMGDYKKPTPPPTSTTAGEVKEKIVKEDEKEDEDDWVSVTTPVEQTKSDAASGSTTIEKPNDPVAAVTAKLEASNIDAPAWSSHATLLYSFFHRLSTLPHTNHQILSHNAYAEILLHSGSFTARNFWSRVILEAFIKTYHQNGFPDDQLDKRYEKIDYDFKDFLVKNPELAWDSLWMVYYSELAWKSYEAMDGLVQSDRRPMNAFLGQSHDKAINHYMPPIAQR